MVAAAYLMIVVAEEHLRDCYQEIADDLRAMPEVKAVERVTGTCEFVAKIEVDHPQRVIVAADRLLAKKWVRHLQVLNVEPLLTSTAE